MVEICQSLAFSLLERILAALGQPQQGSEQGVGAGVFLHALE